MKRREDAVNKWVAFATPIERVSIDPETERSRIDSVTTTNVDADSASVNGAIGHLVTRIEASMDPVASIDASEAANLSSSVHPVKALNRIDLQERLGNSFLSFGGSHIL